MTSQPKAPTLAEYLEVDYAPRSREKPRSIGLTMVMDQAWPNGFTQGVLDYYGDYLDIVKLWDPHARAPVDVVREKVSLYREHEVIVQPGGLFLEIARQRGNYEAVLRRCVELGFNAVEISSTTSTRGSMQADAAAVDLARQFNLRVYGEVGRKFFDGDETRLTEQCLDVDRTVAEFTSLLDAGAEKVYWEGHLLREVIGETPEAITARASTGTQQVLEVSRRVGVENIMFEVSGLRPRSNRQWLQFWLVKLFGPDVNIANARIEEMPNLEAIRGGSHPIFGFGSAGNYPWIRATSEGQDRWWRAPTLDDGRPAEVGLIADGASA